MINLNLPLFNAADPIAAGAPASLQLATTSIKLNDLRATALIDSGASSSFVNCKFVLKHTLRCQPHYENTCLASKDCRANEIGTIAFDVVCQDQLYSNVLFNVMD